MKKLLFVLVFLLGAQLPALASDDHLSEASDPTTFDLAPLFDFDGDSCYPDAAIYKNGSQNPGLPIGGGQTEGCREEINDLNDSNTYHRSVCVTSGGHEYCVHMYALYFEKDQYWSLLGGDKGHTHDVEYALVWTNNNNAEGNHKVTHGSYSAHGCVDTQPLSNLDHDGNHIKIVYHQDAAITHCFRFAWVGEPSENPNGWYTPPVVDWYAMAGDGNIINEVLRTKANSEYNYGSAGFHVKDGNFLSEITKAIPDGYPDCDCTVADCTPLFGGWANDKNCGIWADGDQNLSFCWNKDDVTIDTPTWDAAVAQQIEDHKTYVRIRNRWQSDKYIHIETISDQDPTPEAGQIDPVWLSAQWLLEQPNADSATDPIYFKIRNRWEEHGVKYLHTEFNNRRLEAGGIDSVWLSAQWTLEPTDDSTEGMTYYRIRNRWEDQGIKYIHIENVDPNSSFGMAEAGAIEPGWTSVQWMIHDGSAPDPDNDGIDYLDDNCPDVGNPHQYDLDGDGVGLMCDNVNDGDQDGITQDIDNCPDVGNPRQYDFDGDGLGDVCDPGAGITDADNDGVADTEDNCPNDPNPKQYNFDGDDYGDVCDPPGTDNDNDGWANSEDNCPDIANPKQYDVDGDGIGIVCDDDTTVDQATIDRYKLAEAGAQKALLRWIGAEANAMKARTRRRNAEASAMAARERYITMEEIAMENR